MLTAIADGDRGALRELHDETTAGALRGLSPELRAVVQATVLDGLTPREAGRLLGIPAGARIACGVIR